MPTDQTIIDKLERADGPPVAFSCGHVASPENIKFVRNRTGSTCRICFRAMDAAYRRRVRAALRARSQGGE